MLGDLAQGRGEVGGLELADPDIGQPHGCCELDGREFDPVRGATGDVARLGSGELAHEPAVEQRRRAMAEPRQGDQVEMTVPARHEDVAQERGQTIVKFALQLERCALAAEQAMEAVDKLSGLRLRPPADSAARACRTPAMRGSCRSCTEPSGPCARVSSVSHSARSRAVASGAHASSSGDNR